MTIAAAACQMGVHSPTAGYWVRQATKLTRRSAHAMAAVPGSTTAMATAEPTFMRLVRACDTSAAIEVWTSTVAVRVKPGFDAELSRAVVEALRRGTA